MNLLDIAEPALVVNSKDPVSRVASRMFRTGRHEVLVFEDKDYKGIVVARDLAKRKINEPDKIRIGKFVRMIKPISPETPLEDVINSILINDYKSVPVQKGKKFFVLTKLNILNRLKNDPWFKNKRAGDIMIFPHCVSSSDSITTAMAVLRDLNISRLPVIDEKDRIEGLVDAIDLLKADTDRKRVGMGERAGAKISLREVYVTSLMNKNIPKAGPSTPVKGLIEAMLEKKTPCVVIEDRGRVAGIVTPRLVLKLIGKKVEGVYVRISGLQEEDNFIKSVVDEEIRNEVRKLGKFFPVRQMVIHVDRYHETGRRIKYSVKARMMTGRGMFFADDHAWDVTKAVRGVLQKFEREILKKKKRREVYGRAP